MFSISRRVLNKAVVSVHVPRALCTGVGDAMLFRTTSPARDEAEPIDFPALLKRELELEQSAIENEQKPEEIALEFGDFRVTSNVGERVFTLKSTYGSEKITIRVECDNPTPMDELEELGEENEEAPEGEGFRIEITIAKADGREMRFDGFAGTELSIQHVALADKAGEIPESVYDGPNFLDLDLEVQGGFYQMLAERGIHDELSESIRAYCDAKDQAEYVNWLQKLDRFVSEA